MAEYLIKNGHVFDPVQGIKGDKADVAIKDGKIVDKVGSSAKVIDAKGMTVMAGAVEIHSHIAGPKVNLGRIYRPEDKLFSCTPTHGMERMGGGASIPTTFKTGYEYAKMGYTTAMEAAMPPLFSRHVHEEIRDTPIIDEGAYPVLGNNWFVLEYLRNHEVENTAAYIAWLLKVTKGYAVKVVNPGGTEAWAWGLNCLSIHDPVPYFDITPAQIVKGLIEANEYLGLPHSMHIHPNDLGNPGCYQTTLDTLALAEGLKTHNKFGREQVMHLTHTQFHSYKGTNWADFESGAKEVTDYVNAHKNITIDTGNVTLDETTTMTADGPFEHHLTGLNHLKWANVDVELETAAGVVPYIYSPSISVCAIQWAIGLEIPLMMKDAMRCYITTDHPNAGPFTRYPACLQVAHEHQSPRSADRIVQAQGQGPLPDEYRQPRPRDHVLRARPDDPRRPGKIARTFRNLRRVKARHGSRCRSLQHQPGQAHCKPGRYRESVLPLCRRLQERRPGCQQRRDR